MDINVEKNNTNVNVLQSNYSVDLEENKLDIDIISNNIDVNLTRRNVDVDVSSGGTYNHSVLQNLDYEHAGHTGFQPSGNYIEDNDYVHTDNNYTNDDKNKLASLSNFSGNAIDVNYGANNVQDALDEAFNQLDNKASYDDINNFVSYDSQFKNDNQKLQARTNIHAMSDWIDLGVIDLDEYDGDIYNFMNTLVNTGNYIFKDNSDYFTFNLQVQSSLEEISFVLQKFWTSEEGIEYIRLGIGDDINSLDWQDKGNYLTLSEASYMYARKTHWHYTNVYTDNLEEWLENLTIENSGGQPYSQFIVVYNNELYIVNQYYDNRLVNGVSIRNRSQSYYKENEPWIVYSRYGRARNYSPYQIDWQNWNISISERQDGEQSNLENYEDNLKTEGKYKCNDGYCIYKYDVNVNDIGGYIYQKRYTYGDDSSYEEAIRYYDGNSWSQWTIIN